MECADNKLIHLAQYDDLYVYLINGSYFYYIEQSIILLTVTKKIPTTIGY